MTALSLSLSRRLGSFLLPLINTRLSGTGNLFSSNKLTCFLFSNFINTNDNSRVTLYCHLLFIHVGNCYYGGEKKKYISMTLVAPLCSALLLLLRTLKPF